jgi:hypothetical protein
MSLLSRRTVPLILLMILTSLPARAVIRTVEIDGSGEYTVIQEALVASTDGDSVMVGPGIYSWTNQGSGDDHGLVRYWLNEQDGVRLISTDGPEVTIIDAEGQGRVFFANGSNNDDVNILLKGFTLRNGWAPKVPNRLEQEGGAMALHLTLTNVVDCIFENNVAEHGGAVWMGGVGAYNFTNCRFIGNRAERIKPDMPYNPFGGAMTIFGSPERITISGCTFIGNHSDYRGGGVFIGKANVEIRDCLFSANTTSGGTTRHGTAIYGFQTNFLRLDGVTVRDHESAPGAAVRVIDTKVFEMEHSLVANSVMSGQTVQLENTGSVSVSCTNLYGGFPGNWIADLMVFKGVDGNTELDPMFCGGGGDLRRVESSSPMLAANNSCAQDVGRILSDCLGVPILAASLHGHRQVGTVRLEWDGVDPLSAGLWLERRAAGSNTELDLAGATGLGTGHWVFEDARAPLDAVDYVLRDNRGQELARAKIPAAAWGLRLAQASPNPFNPRTHVAFELAEAGHVDLDIYDSRGRHVATLVNGRRTAGMHEEVFNGVDDNGRELGSGVYHLRLESGGLVRKQSIVLVR